MTEKTNSQSPFVGFSSRKAFGKVLVELAKENDDIVALTADLTDSVQLTEFQKTFPDRFVNFGVAEQNMTGAAAGLTLAGKIPFTCTYAAFSSMRATEQMRTDIAYNDLPVRIVSTHGGVTFDVAGATHQAIEDVGIYRGIAGMTVIAPADAVETVAVIRAVVDLPGPVYVRLNRVTEKTVYTHDFIYKIGKPDLLKPGKNLLLVATAVQVGETLNAEKLLQDKGLDARVLNLSSVKPIDEKALVEIIKDYPAVMTVEQHSILNGTGSAVAEIIAQNNLDVAFYRHGLQDIFTTSGPYKELLVYYKLDPEGICETALKFLDQS